MNDILDAFKAVVGALVFLIVLYIGLVIGGVVGHWLYSIFMFGWNLL